MTPATLNLTIWRGITFGPLKIYCLDADQNPVNIEGWTALAEARKGSDVIDLEPEITDGANGEITIAFTDEETWAMAAADMKWDLLLENAAGERMGRFLAGSFKIKKPVTEAQS